MSTRLRQTALLLSVLVVGRCDIVETRRPLGQPRLLDGGRAHDTAAADLKGDARCGAAAVLDDVDDAHDGVAVCDIDAARSALDFAIRAI